MRHTIFRFLDKKKQPCLNLSQKPSQHIIHYHF